MLAKLREWKSLKKTLLVGSFLFGIGGSESEIRLLVDGGSNNTQAYLDEVKIYSCALTEGQIQLEYNQTKKDD